MKLDDVTFQDRCIIPISTFEKNGINCYKKIPLDDRLSPETIKMFPKERYATLYRSARLSDYVILNSTYEQLSVLNVRSLSIYSIELLTILHDKFYSHKENTTEYAIDSKGNLYQNPNANPLYKKIEIAILEKQKKIQKAKKQKEIIEKANKILNDKTKDHILPDTEACYLLNISTQSYKKLLKNDEFFKNKEKITLNDLLTWMNISYNGKDVIHHFERLYNVSNLEERYDYNFRGGAFLVKIQDNLPYLTIFSRKYYTETDVLKFDDFMYKRYAIIPKKDL